MIERFFNDKPPYIVSYSMEQAIKVDPPALCPYYYYPHIVRLRDIEMDEYKKISLQLLRMGMVDKNGNFKIGDPKIEKKLLERKRIIHKAANKLDTFKDILKVEYQKRQDKGKNINLEYTLVYVPEGLAAEYDDEDYHSKNDSQEEETKEDQRLIDDYTIALNSFKEEVDLNKIYVRQFTGVTRNREEILQEFAAGNIHVLTSMKCLDEGVDVPRSELAIFCSSTGNPRQFIQRRGRVLRKAEGKDYATIHDLVVIPEMSGNDMTFNMEKSMIKKELERVVDFSNLAENKSETYQVFKEILDKYELSLGDFSIT